MNNKSTGFQRRWNSILSAVFLLAVFGGWGAVQPAGASDPVVRAVLFYSPQCPHCQMVRETVLTELEGKYGGSFQLLEIDTSTDAVEFYFSTVEFLDIPPEKQGVPTIIIGEEILVGSHEIPEYLPELVAEGLDAGGIDWPDIPGIEEYLPSAALPQVTAPASLPPAAAETGPDSTQETPEITPGNRPPEEPQPGLLETITTRYRRDFVGNTLSVLVLIGMLAVLLESGTRLLKPDPNRQRWPAWVVPLLSAAGLAVAGYLSFVEVTQAEAVCGPVGDCNTVQQSPYAVLFGFLPVGVFGLLGYIAILADWLIYRFSSGWVQEYAGQGLWMMTFFGLLFSIYLTFLEPFVIGATCAWCLSSAVIITVQHLAATSLVESSWAESA